MRDYRVIIVLSINESDLYASLKKSISKYRADNDADLEAMPTSIFLNDDDDDDDDNDVLPVPKRTIFIFGCERTISA